MISLTNDIQLSIHLFRYIKEFLNLVECISLIQKQNMRLIKNLKLYLDLLQSPLIINF